MSAPASSAIRAAIVTGLYALAAIPVQAQGSHRLVAVGGAFAA